MTDLLKLYLSRIGLKSSEIKTLKLDTVSLCPCCNLRKTSNWANLKPCNHQICFTCLDTLYDNYTNVIDNKTLFSCPYCDEMVDAYMYDSTN